MFSKINVCQIIKGHLKTLRYDTSDNQVNWWEIVFFIFLPIGIAVLAIYEKIILKAEPLTIIATVAVTFMALMFSVLIMVLDRYQRTEKDLALILEEGKEPQHNEHVKLIVLTELYYNISYSTIIALTLSFISVITAIFTSNNCFSIILSSIVIALGLNIILTILMIIKRIYIIFNPSN